METMTITLQLPDGLKAWLTTEGAPLFRSATQQAAYLCSEYLKRASKTSGQPSKNGTKRVHPEEETPSHDAASVGPASWDRA
jgi:hypothetical protein